MRSPQIRDRMRTARLPAPAAADRRRILICDDDAELALILAEHLRSCGHAVELCATAEQALVRFAAGAPAPAEVVITDLGMPDADGSELLDLLRDKHPAIRVILMTADALVNERTLAGCSCPVLGKPCRLDDIEQLIGDCQPRPVGVIPPQPSTASRRRNLP